MKPAYVKHLGFVTKKAGLSHQAFLDHWCNRHAVLVRKMPGLLRYTGNVVDRSRFPQFEYDGFSELWYESEAARDRSFESAEAKIVVADLPNFVERSLIKLARTTAHCSGRSLACRGRTL